MPSQGRIWGPHLRGPVFMAIFGADKFSVAVKIFDSGFKKIRNCQKELQYFKDFFIRSRQKPGFYLYNLGLYGTYGQIYGRA